MMGAEPVIHEVLMVILAYLLVGGCFVVSLRISTGRPPADRAKYFEGILLWPILIYLAYSNKLKSDWPEQGPVFRSGACRGESCSICRQPADHKVEEAIQFDDPLPNRHPLTAYVCHSCFVAIMGPAARRKS